MTEIIYYRCDVCGQAFGDPDDCRACERKHLFSELKNQIHAYNRHRNPLDILSCSLDDVEFIFCDTEEAARAYYNWCRDCGFVCPYDIVFEEHKVDFKPGLWCYDYGNDWGHGDRWVYLPDKLDELTTILEYFQQ